MLANYLRSEEALQEHTYASDFANVVFRGSSRTSPGFGLSGGDIIDLRLAYNKELERIVTARKGRRIILKEYVNLLPIQMIHELLRLTYGS